MCTNFCFLVKPRYRFSYSITPTFANMNRFCFLLWWFPCLPSEFELSRVNCTSNFAGSITPSVSLFCNIPEDITQSFYRGQVNVTYKDSVFQPSCSLRFAAELLKVLNESNFSAEVTPHIFMVTDGGPEHRLNFHSLKIPLLILFSELCLQLFVAIRTAPGHSYINTVERIMSILNIGFQNVALERKESPSDDVIKTCKNMEDLQKNQGVNQDWQDSVKHT